MPGRADYQERQETRRERYESAAMKAERESAQRFERARGSIAGIPPGQPVLVGHHSEKRHRAALRRHDSNMDKGLEADQKAHHYAAKAAGVGRAGISSDDPEAIAKLREKLAGMEAKQEEMKAANRAWVKAGKPNPGGRHDWHGGKPYPPYALSNNNGNMRRVRQRIEELESLEAAPEFEQVRGDGWTLYLDDEENRVVFDVDDRSKNPELKQAGFKWSRLNQRWQRLANGNGRGTAKWLAQRWLDAEAEGVAP